MSAMRVLISHPASTTHSQLSDEQLAESGIRPETVRLSVGLEDPADLIADLDQRSPPQNNCPKGERKRMIYVTGDIHADLDRFKGKEQKS